MKKMKRNYENSVKGFWDYAADNISPSTKVVMKENGTLCLESESDGMVLGSFSEKQGLKTYYFKD